MNRFEDFLTLEKESLEEIVQDLHRKKYSEGRELKSYFEGRIREVEMITKKYQEMKNADEKCPGSGNFQGQIKNKLCKCIIAQNRRKKK